MQVDLGDWLAQVKLEWGDLLLFGSYGGSVKMHMSVHDISHMNNATQRSLSICSVAVFAEHRHTCRHFKWRRSH